MMYSVIIADSTLDALNDFIDYVAKNSCERALKYKNYIMSKITLLETQPNIGMLHETGHLREKGYRKFRIKKHIVYYFVDNINKQVNITKILHGAMKQSKHLKDLQ